MAKKAITPASIRAPFGHYNHAVLTEGGGRTLHLSGQLGIAPDGTIQGDVTGQSEQAFANIDAVLAAAGLTRSDVVKLTTYLIEPADRAAYMRVRDAWVALPAPASTLLFIKALAQPEFLVEIEAIAVADA